MCHLPISLIGEAMNFEIANLSFGSNRQLRHFIIGLSAKDLCRFCEIGSQSDSISCKSIQNERLFKLTECQLEHCWVWMTDINFPFELVHLTAPRWNFPDWYHNVSVSKTCFAEIRSLNDSFLMEGLTLEIQARLPINLKSKGRPAWQNVTRLGLANAVQDVFIPFFHLKKSFLYYFHIIRKSFL